MQRFCTLIILAVWGLCFDTVSEAKTIGHKSIKGIAHVRDGDSLLIGAYEIRLFGVDAFELHQTCGKMACGRSARDFMRKRIDHKYIVCSPKARDKYGRFVAVCVTQEGQDIGAELVRHGLGVAYRTYSYDYVDEEQKARAAKAGAWGFGFQSPLKYRKVH